MTLVKPAKEAATQGPKNELMELKKMMDILTKKVDAQSRKVSTALYSLLCACVGLLSLTPLFLESLLIEIVEAGWEEVRRQEQGEERQVCRNRKTKGQKGPSCQGRSLQGQRQGQGRGLHFKVKEAG